MEKETATAQIEKIIFNLLEENPGGLQWSEIRKQVESKNPNFHSKTVNGIVWKLPEKYPDKVYKPERGVFRLRKYNEG